MQNTNWKVYTLNTIDYRIVKKTLPHGGHVKLLHSEAEIETKNIKPVDGDMYTTNVIIFHVVCTRMSTEVGAEYTVYGTIRRENKTYVIDVIGYIPK